ncbi:PLP-dependent aminotransferase family protein [Niveibacterium sp. SC-1]|uniref:MocR-like pyridoxine biosynthesis transcription factor PdxR n=1 Tax=Niveibacterium sp. SC-1 TaxID=3135646 RepID=UPI00311F913D
MSFAGPVLPFSPVLPPAGSRLRQHVLHQQLQAAIADGRLAADLRLPGSRTLAEACGVSRNCVVAVYERLLAEGYVVARNGGGTYVAPVRATRRAESPAPQIDARERLAPAWRDLPEALRFGPRDNFAFDFAVGVPDRSEFPLSLWRSLSAQALRRTARASATYLVPEGQPSLREAIAAHASFIRAVSCSASELIVTSGAQQAFDLIARLFVEPGKTVVAVEEPGYPPLRRVFAAAGARIVPIAVDREGLVVEDIPPEARIVCVTPTHQFPMGPALSARRRLALLAFAQKHEALIVEDDYDSEFLDAARPLDALQTLDRGQSVFYVGTFSKSLLPTLRLGYVIAPPWAISALASAKQMSDWHCAESAQEALAAFIAQGHLARHLRRMRKVYAQRRRILLHALERHGAGLLHPVTSGGGLHATALLRDDVDARALVTTAAARGVRVASIAGFCMQEAAPNGLVFGLGAIPAELIDEGVSTLVRLALKRS